VNMDSVTRIIPVVVAAGRLWQTSHLWAYLDEARDQNKCKPFEDSRVAPLQALDIGEYERLLAVTHDGAALGDLLARKAAGPYRHRDLAIWLADTRPVADYQVRLPAVEKVFRSMVSGLESRYGRPPA
jgi:hypothetical protein